MSATARKIDTRELATRPLTPGLSVEVLDLDIATADEASLLGLDAVVASNPVVVVRGQKLTPPQLLTLSGRYGRVSPQRRTAPHPEFPGISILSNKKDANGKLIGAPDAGRNWHTDGTTYHKLGLTTILYGIECPAEGADTCFVDAAGAFNALPEARQKEVEKLQLIHNRAFLLRKYTRGTRLIEAGDLDQMEDVIHPAVVTSPIDGRKTFFLTNGSTRGVVGMDDEEGRALVRNLITEAASQEQFVYRHKWQEGDIVTWNNMCTLHMATPFDEEKYERLVHRVWIRPVDTTD